MLAGGSDHETDQVDENVFRTATAWDALSQCGLQDYPQQALDYLNAAFLHQPDFCSVSNCTLRENPISTPVAAVDPRTISADPIQLPHTAKTLFRDKI